MSFKSVNEAEKFRYEDCCIVKRVGSTTDFILEVEALIVKSDNSQNTNFTESYADVTRITFKNATVLMGIRDGMKKYDADGKLVEVIEDEILHDDELGGLCDNLTGMYLVGLERINDSDDYVLFIEKANEEQYDTLPSDSYQVKIHCDEVNMCWERYLNRVQM